MLSYPNFYLSSSLSTLYIIDLSSIGGGATGPLAPSRRATLTLVVL